MNQNFTEPMVLLNKWCGFKDVLINNKTSNQEVSYLIFENVNNDIDKYHYQLNEFYRKLSISNFLFINNLYFL